MARRNLDPAEEERLIAEVEARRDAGEPLGEGRPVNRGTDPSVVLSVRISLEQMRLLRAVAQQRRETVSDVLKDALYAYTGIGGSRVWYGGSVQSVAFFSGLTPVRAEAVGQPYASPGATVTVLNPASKSSGTLLGV